MGHKQRWRIVLYLIVVAIGAVINNRLYFDTVDSVYHGTPTPFDEYLLTHYLMYSSLLAVAWSLVSLPWLIGLRLGEVAVTLLLVSAGFVLLNGATFTQYATFDIFMNAFAFGLIVIAGFVIPILYSIFRRG